jgi:hypothetical protein
VRELATERVGRDVVDEGALAIDLDDGQPLAVARLEFLVAADVDLLELETELVAQRRDRFLRPLAEVATVRVIDDNGRQRLRLSS